MSHTKTELIYLTGLMGSGKSTVAPVLAAALNFSYVDTDDEIQRHTGKTISDIFHHHGEQYFRTLERDILLNICGQEQLVVALGGGTLTHNENLHTVTSSGVLISLKTDVDEIVRRVRMTTDRPLLESKGGGNVNDDELKTRVQELLKLREPFYNQADIIINTNNKEVQSIVEEIVSELNKNFAK